MLWTSRRNDVAELDVTQEHSIPPVRNYRHCAAPHEPMCKSRLAMVNYIEVAARSLGMRPVDWEVDLGQEVECTAHWNGKISVGKAHLDTDHVLFRGEFRVKVPFDEVREVRSADGHLLLKTDTTEISLEIGRKSDRWLDAIRNPKSLIDKLEVKRGGRAAVLCVDDARFHGELATRLATSDGHAEQPPYDWIFFGVEITQDLKQLEDLKGKLAPKGMIWVIMRKGKAATVKDADLFPAASEAGMAVVKVAAFSETHTAQKLVVRKTP